MNRALSRHSPEAVHVALIYEQARTTAKAYRHESGSETWAQLVHGESKSLMQRAYHSSWEQVE